LRRLKRENDQTPKANINTPEIELNLMTMIRSKPLFPLQQQSLNQSAPGNNLLCNYCKLSQVVSNQPPPLPWQPSCVHNLHVSA